VSRTGGTRPLAAVVWGVVLIDVLAVAAVVVGLIPEPPNTPPGGSWIFLFLTVVYGVVAGRVVTAQPRNAAGWAMWLQPTLIALSGAGSGYALRSVESYGGSLPGTALIALVGGIGLLPFIAIGLVIEPLVFPDGHLPSRRWRPAMAIASAATLGICVGSGGLFTPGPMAGFPTLVNPLGLPMGQAITDVVTPVSVLLLFVAMILAVTAVVVRFRRGTLAERQQAKWFAAGVAVPAALLVLSLSLGPFVEDVTFLWVASIAALGLIPIAIGIAIMRYRLYEIDRIVSRTIGWAITSALVIAIFIGMVLAVQMLLSSVASEDTLVVAGSTLVAAAVFQPLRKRVQHRVDQRFNRSRVDAQLAIDRFASTLRDEGDQGSVRDRLLGALNETVAPRQAGVWIRGDDARHPGTG
jgi:hypothetical protein